ncbi:MAG: glycosyl hydrolase family 18 protein [[Ruminococcus] gnavus]|nr:glycosyl hydrolase family 18 protein [Mediterraneibacter gnavus]
MDEREERAVRSRNTAGKRQNTKRTRPRGRTGEPEDIQTGRERRPASGRRRKSSRARRRQRNMLIRIILLVLVILMAVGGLIFWRRYGSSDERANLEQYYGMTDPDDLAVVVNNQVIGKADNGEYGAGGRMIDGQAYIEYSVLHDFVNKRFYWDANENILLYTLPDGSVSVSAESKEYTEINDTKSEEYVILKTDGTTAYVALDFVKKYTDMEYKEYQKPNRVMIVNEFGKTTTAVMKRDSEVRFQGGVKSLILTEVKKSGKVTVIEDEDGWKKVRTSDGFIGYVKTNALKHIKEETIASDFQEPVYHGIQKDHKLNMAWHNVENTPANAYVSEMIAPARGLTTIAPTWFHIADTQGNINSIADAEYVNAVHQANLEVWAVLRDFHGGINSAEETYEVLSYTSKRTNLIDQVIASALANGIDGINLDFELISAECGEHYVQFVRELSVKCHQNGLVFSVDNYVPMPYNTFYDLNEQAVFADYVVIMGYDEHVEGSYEAGSVASYGYVKDGIENALKAVPKEKLINAIPLYTRLWFESPKTESELAAEAGTEAANYPNKVTSTALGMEEAQQKLREAGVEAVWDEQARQNYAQWEADGGTYKIWLEDEKSLKEKLELIQSHDLAGVAEWRLGWEDPAVWDLILQYVS